MTALPMEAVAEPYVRLRAIHHLEKGYIVVLGCGIGQPFVTTDYPAVQRALELQVDALLVAKKGVDGVYEADPRVDPKARRFVALGYDDVIRRELRVMDQAAFILARDHGLPLHIFDVDERGVMRRVCEGDAPGTVIRPGAGAELEGTA